MKCTTLIDTSRDEEVVIYAHERSALVERIEELVVDSAEMVGYSGDSIMRFSALDAAAFISEKSGVYALVGDERLKLKDRLYKLEEALDSDFVKINQSCIANIKKIKRFRAAVGGALMVEFQNGYQDYVSRRQLKGVKERLGIK